MAGRADPGFADCRRVDDTQNGLAIAQERYKGPEEGIAGHKFLSTVYGVQNPNMACPLASSTKFLTDDAVIWKGRFDDLA